MAEPNKSIENHLLIKFSDKVKHAYQNEGFFLRGLVRHDGIRDGKTIKFQKIGKATAGKKQRGGKVPTGATKRSVVEMTMEKTYCMEWYENFDQILTNYDQSTAIIKAQAMALGREHDAELVSVLDALTVEEGGLQEVYWVKAKPLNSIDKILTAFDKSEVMISKDTSVILPQSAWSDLMRTAQFSSADYIGADDLPFKGVSAKYWNGFTVMRAPVSSMFNEVGGKVQAYAFDMTALGYEGDTSIQTTAENDIDYDAWKVRSDIMSASGVIDAAGIVRIII